MSFKNFSASHVTSSKNTPKSKVKTDPDTGVPAAQPDKKQDEAARTHAKKS